MEKQEPFNAIELGLKFPRKLFERVYLYADISEPQSFRTFKRNGLRSFRLIRSLQKRSSPRFCLIQCKMDKREEQAFLKSLDDLYRDLLIMGYRDYEQYCAEVFPEIIQAVQDFWENRRQYEKGIRLERSMPDEELSGSTKSAK